MGRKNTCCTFKIPTETFEKFQKEAAETGKSMSNVLSHQIRLIYPEPKKPEMKLGAAWINRETLDQIKGDAKARGMSLSRFLGHIVTHGEIPPDPSELPLEV